MSYVVYILSTVKTENSDLQRELTDGNVEQDSVTFNDEKSEHTPVEKRHVVAGVTVIPQELVPLRVLFRDTHS